MCRRCGVIEFVVEDGRLSEKIKYVRCGCQCKRHFEYGICKKCGHEVLRR